MPIGERHLFYTDDAVAYGVAAAVVLHNLTYWIAFNKSRGTHVFKVYIDDMEQERTWTYNAIADFAKAIPYLSQKQVWRIVDKLVRDKVLIRGWFNHTNCDRTSWYCFRDESRFYQTGK